MIFFSDAGIAIMLTLLALELPVPEGDTVATWGAHHMLFTHAHRADPPLITLNLLAYVLVPWASKTLAESTGGAGVALYSAVMAFLGLSMLLVLRHVRRAGLLQPETPASVFGGIRAWTVTTMLMFALTIPAALLFGRAVMFVWPVIYLGLRLTAVLNTRQGKRAAAQ